MLGQLQKENTVTVNKMEEQIQQVTMKDPKNHRKREQVKAQRESQTNLIYYGAGAAPAIGVLGIIGYYVYQSKTDKETPVNQLKESPVQQLAGLVQVPKKTPVNKFDMD